MAIPNSFIMQLRQTADIEDVMSSYCSITRAGRNQKCLCPFHSEKTPSMVIYPDTQSFYCFGCGAGGDVITFIMKIENLDYPEAIRFLARRYNMAVPDEGGEDRAYQMRTRIYALNREAARFFHACLLSPAGKPGLDYLTNRQLTEKTIKTYGLGFAPQGWDHLISHLRSKGFTMDEMIAAAVVARSDRNGRVRFYDQFRNRVMFPIIDLRGNVIAFGGRALEGDDGAKYLNSSDTIAFKKSRNLFALNFAKVSKRPGLILAEGYMDVIALHQAGFDNAVATLGTSLTDEQARLISQYADKVVLAYDSDGPGQAATKRAINIFDEVGVKVSVLSMTGAKDPDEFIQKFGAERFSMLLDGSRGALDFELSKLRAQFDTGTPEGKVGFLKEACRLFAGVRNPVEREVYITQTANELQIAPQAIKAQIQNLDKQDYYRDRSRQRKDMNLYIGNMAAAKDDLQRRTHLRYAMAEEGILYCLLKNPDFYRQIAQKIGPQDFVTDQNRALYQALAERLEQGQPIEMFDLSSSLSPEAMGRVSAILASAPTQRCDEAALEDYINRLLEHRSEKTEKEVAQMDEQALGEYVRQLAEKKKRK